MTPGTDPAPVIAGVIESLREARGLLLDPNPGNIEFCRVAVSQSIPRLINAMQSDRSVWKIKQMKSLLLDVRHELNAIAGLLDSAAAFRRNRAKAAAASQMFTIDADPPPAKTARHVHVVG